MYLPNLDIWNRIAQEKVWLFCFITEKHCISLLASNQQTHYCLLLFYDGNISQEALHYSDVFFMLF